MKIRKKFQGVLPEHKILDTISSSQTDTYSCRKINELVANAGGGGGTGGSGASVDQIYPVGSIYISASATVDPNEVFLGTSWERFGKGRTLVSVNEEDEDFATVGLEGGHKSLQEHTHTIASSGAHMHATQGRTSSGSTTPSIFESLAGTGGTRTVNVPRSGTNGAHTHTVETAGDGDSGNLQPFITVFMWQRVA